jgi:hypothetical protein
MAVLNLNPETFSTGALINNVDAKIVKAEFRMFTYPGGISEPAPVLELTFETNDGETHSQVYTVGSADRFRPSVDGSTIEVLAEGSTISRNSNLAIFIKSLCDAGFDTSKLNDGKASAFVGVRAHLVRKNFGVKQNGKEKEILVVDRLITDGNSANTATTTTNAVTENANAISADEQFAIDSITMAIAEAGGKMSRADVVKTYMATTKGNPLQRNGLRFVADAKFLAKHFNLTQTEISLKD